MVPTSPIFSSTRLLEGDECSSAEKRSHILVITTRTTLPFNPRYDSKTRHDALSCGDDDWEINWRNYDHDHGFSISKSSVRARWFGTCRHQRIGEMTLLCTLVCDPLTCATSKSVISLHVCPPTRIHRHMCGHLYDGRTVGQTRPTSSCTRTGSMLRRPHWQQQPCTLQITASASCSKS